MVKEAACSYLRFSFPVGETCTNHQVIVQCSVVRDRSGLGQAALPSPVKSEATRAARQAGGESREKNLRVYVTLIKATVTGSACITLDEGVVRNTQELLPWKSVGGFVCGVNREGGKNYLSKLVTAPARAFKLGHRATPSSLQGSYNSFPAPLVLLSCNRGNTSPTVGSPTNWSVLENRINRLTKITITSLGR